MHLSLRTYRAAQTLLAPVIDLYLYYRRKIGKEDVSRFGERLGKTSVARPQGSLLWVHGASIGEAVSVLPLITKIKEEYPGINILVTTGTVTSAKMLEKKLPRGMIHQFVPVDSRHAVKRFLDHWRPDLALWVESELWPNLICDTHASGCPIVLVNARMSASSFGKWKRYRHFADEVFGCFSACLAQNDAEAERFAGVGVNNVTTAGNLKYEAPPLPADPTEMGRMVAMTGNRQVWFAASTSEGEDEMVAAAHKKAAESVAGLLTVIAPRHPYRAKDIVKMLTEQGYNVAQRSKQGRIEADTQFYIADTIGEMGIFYRMAELVFVGGSLVPHGGQNPLEPARLDCAIITGPQTHNFREIYAEMEHSVAVLRINDAEALVEAVSDMLNSPERRNKLASNALHFVNSRSGIVERYMETLKPYLKPLVRDAV